MKIVLGILAVLVAGFYAMTASMEAEHAERAASEAAVSQERAGKQDDGKAEGTTSAQESQVAETVSKPEPVTKQEVKTPIKLSDMDESDQAIRLAIIQSGNLCARPIEVRPAGAEGLYGVQCIMYRNGAGRANYLLNSQTGEVVPI
jgi:hypothetical protein